MGGCLRLPCNTIRWGRTGRYVYDSSGAVQQNCIGYCYPGVLDTVGASCCSNSLRPGTTSDADFSELAVSYASDTCKAYDRPLYVVRKRTCLFAGGST